MRYNYLMKKPLTSKQKGLLVAMSELERQNGKPPTLEELREYLRYGNTSSVQRHMYALMDKGYVRNDKNKSRSFEIVSNQNTFVQIPLVGRCPCGAPFLAQENIEAYIPYDPARLKGDAHDYFFLQAVGDSMDKAGINSGDYVLIRKADYADPGQRVVALIGDEATIKKLEKTEDHYILRPETTNPVNKPIYVFDGLSIQGIVADVVKPGSVI